MLVGLEKIQQAKEKLGVRNADIIAELFQVEKWDARNHKGLCPFHREDTPSFIYNPRTYKAKCFGCGKVVDVLDAYVASGKTYMGAVQALFEEAGVHYAFGELGVKTRAQYRYPKEVPINDKNNVYEYLAKRCISKETIDGADVREDEHGNIVFNYYDTNDVLCLVKYRPSHKVDKSKGELKAWCQKDADTTPLLFNMNRVNVDAPLLVCEGEIDCLAAIEAGWSNAVSVPFGANNYNWIEENFDWLEQFESIIICADNDEAGTKMQKECVFRLGSWKTKFIEIPRIHTNPDGSKIALKDLNEVLYYKGKQMVLELIANAKDSPVDSVSDFSEITSIDLDAIDGIPTGIASLDKRLMKLFYGSFNIVTGVNGCVDRDTEFFDGTRWKRISDYKEGDMVLQYNADGTSNLVYPQKYHKYPCEQLWHLHSQYGVDQMVSDEHNVVYLTSRGNVAKIPANQLVQRHNESKNGFSGSFITTFKYDGVGIHLTDDEIRLMCAVICDGHFPSRKKVVPYCRINLKKERKKERLEWLLDKCGISYRKEQYNPKNPDFNTYIFYAPMVTKVFTGEWYQCSQRQLSIIADEIVYWDGSTRRGRTSFSTTVKENADFIQFAFTASGYRSSILDSQRIDKKSVEYTVTKTTQIAPQIKNVKNKITIPSVRTKDGYKYCFTVPSGMLVLRRNGKINITGNSGKSSFLSSIICNSIDNGQNAFLYSGELPNFQSKNWINYILAGQRHVSQHQSNGATYWKVTKEAQDGINQYYKGRLFIYKDGYDHKVDSLLKAMEDTTRKYGVKLHIIDNLTSVNLECNDNNKYQRQEEFVTRLIDFAKKYNVTICLVVHPHKIETMRRLTKMDIQGISAIIDLAHRIISLYRVTQEDKNGVPKQNGKGWYKEPIKYDVLCDILKDRMLGYEGSSVGLFYDKPSRRFFENEEDLDRQYKWDTGKYDSELPYPPVQLYDTSEEVFGRIEQ